MIPSFFLLLLYMLLVAPMGFLRDGAAARHIVSGLYILEHGRPATSNYLWYVDPLAPWQTHELLTDFTLGCLYRLTGEYQLVVLAAAVAMALAISLAAQSAIKSGRCPMLSLAPLVVLAATATSLHWSARAHIFSYVFLSLTMGLARSKLSTGKLSGLLFLLFAAWVNFHGSAILGLPLVLALTLARQAEQKAAPTPTSKPFLACLPLLAALLGCLSSLRGMHYFSFLLQYATQGQILGQGSEWTGIDTAYGIGTWAYLILALIFLANCVKNWKQYRRPDLLPLTLVTLGFAMTALPCMRIIPYASLLMLSMFEAKAKPEERKEEEPSAHAGKWKGASPLLLSLTAILILSFAATAHIKDMNPHFLPVRCSNFLKDNCNKETRGFAYDNWGNYLYIKCGQSFFIDDKTEFYPKDFNTAYRALLLAQSGYQDFIKEARFPFILIPRQAPLAEALEASGKWRIAERDEDAYLFMPVQAPLSTP
ncbi:MAG TPA: hypothetical protein PLC15_13020 [Candidatus Obscuribacter sp.]|nr:hypothetical protein [Candidatus Obscuribacter sp.]HMY02683.1 hypothetical protein [Candidatus Obscuribacter sp.]HNA73978.1 hypothetical protein [Candidatus Obscuribacter sp.]HNB16297.1 hypothetical protein [Candidatus Obscuribacter sp.]HNG73043.1 hypothetical protein [Candidatus Obscuribacter sp.]